MEQKVKFAIIGLIGLLLVSLIFILQMNSAKQTLDRQIDKLNDENASLRKQVDSFSTERRQLEYGVNSLKEQINSNAQEKADLQKKYDLVDEARKELVQQVKALKAQKAAAAASPTPQAETGMSVSAPQTEDAYWGGILKAKTDLELQLGDLRKELKNLQISNEQLQREKTALELDVAGLSRDKEELKHKIEYNQKIMDSLTAEFVREKNEKTHIQDGVKTVSSENEVLRRQLKSLNSRKITLERKLTDIQNENSGLENRFSEMEILLREKVSQIDTLKQQLDLAQRGIGFTEQKREAVELAPIVVRPQQETSAQETSLMGKVIAINRDNNFVVIDLGQDRGVKIGDAFQVYRDNNPIANVEVIQIRKSIAACDIKREAATIKVGDAVR